MPNFSIQFKDSDCVYQIKIKEHTLILPGDFPSTPHLPSLSLSGDEHILDYKIDFQDDKNLQQKNKIKRFFQDSCQFSSDNDKQQFMSDFDQIFQPSINNVNYKKDLYKGIYFGIAAIILLAITLFLIALFVLTQVTLHSTINLLDQAVAVLKEEGFNLIFLAVILPLILTFAVDLFCVAVSAYYTFEYQFNHSLAKSNNVVDSSTTSIISNDMELEKKEEDQESESIEAEDGELNLFNYKKILAQKTQEILEDEDSEKVILVETNISPKID